MKTIRPTGLLSAIFGISIGAALSAVLTATAPAQVTVPASSVADVAEFPLDWPTGTAGSTHELTYNHKGGSVFWVTGQTHDSLARVTFDGQATFFAMPAGSGPHGIIFDNASNGNLWATLEFSGLVVEIDQTTGKIIHQIDVSLHAAGASAPINTHPHGLGLDPDGRTLWFTGKSTGTVGRIDPDGSVHHFALPSVGSVPIYIVAGPDGAMWCTELVSNRIARITHKGIVTEYTIPTYNSRPIAITPGPDGHSMWFSEEAGSKIGRIDLNTRTLVEYPLPFLHENSILASLDFDRDGNLWTQAYINPNNDVPPGPDAIVKLDRSIVDAIGADISSVPIAYYQVPTANTVMHRITQGPDGAIWFTELGTDKLGRLGFIDTATAAKRPKPVKKAPAAQEPRIRIKPEVCG